MHMAYIHTGRHSIYPQDKSINLKLILRRSRKAIAYVNLHVYFESKSNLYHQSNLYYFSETPQRAAEKLQKI